MAMLKGIMNPAEKLHVLSRCFAPFTECNNVIKLKLEPESMTLVT
jgi:hypothetical protein